MIVTNVIDVLLRNVKVFLYIVLGTLIIIAISPHDSKGNKVNIP